MCVTGSGRDPVLVVLTVEGEVWNKVTVQKSHYLRVSTVEDTSVPEEDLWRTSWTDSDEVTIENKHLFHVRFYYYVYIISLMYWSLYQRIIVMVNTW